MMLCKADFEELFPELRRVKKEETPGPSMECVSRWEDDGGAPVSVRPPGREHSRSQFANPMFAVLLGMAAIHSAMQLGKIAMPPRPQELPSVIR
ncbi:hypothetical protein ACGYKB_10990 [Sulfitobacter sp. 916]|uniref:hypothetical protein n=1 Tax=unclassified Sulfitobacter TaxID=196795 RepID=UPI0032DE8C31